MAHLPTFFILYLGFFYFLLNNLPPHMRSKTSSIQLFAIVKRKFIDKYSMANILKPLMNDLLKKTGEINCAILEVHLYIIITPTSCGNIGRWDPIRNL